MKCPKCNFISFDYNQACPKCGYDLSHERELMNFPSYKPKPLSLLGLLAGEGELPATTDSSMGASELSGLHGSDTQELLISLDSLSDEGHEPVQLEPKASLTASEKTIEKGAMTSDDEFVISLDEFSDEGPDMVHFNSETNAETREPEMAGEVFFEPETFVSEDASPQQQGFWESEAVEPESLLAIEADDVFQQDDVILDKRQEDPGRAKEEKSDVFELELEPLELELDMEVEEPDKKTS